MDSLTHLALGACLGAALAPPAQRRRAALAGALLNTLPDLDFLPLAFVADPVMRFSWHRGATHSLLVLPFVALAIWAIGRARSALVREAPGRWLLVIFAALLSHPLLDAFTVYGTQLLWPLDQPPVMWASLFIVDPLFTLPLAIGALVAWRSRDARHIGWWASMGIGASVVYLAWTLTAKANLEQAVRADLARRGHPDSKVLTVPAPLQSLLWRVLVMNDDGSYYEGFFSYVAGKPLSLELGLSSPGLLAPIANARDVERLKWFTRGFYAVRADGDRIVMTDLRMGSDNDYLFRYAVGDERDGKTVPLEPAELLPWPRDVGRQAALVWKRLRDPAALP